MTVLLSWLLPKEPSELVNNETRFGKAWIGNFDAFLIIDIDSKSVANILELLQVKYLKFISDIETIQNNQIGCDQLLN